MMKHLQALLLPLTVLCACLAPCSPANAAIPPKGNKLFSITGVVTSGVGLSFNEAGQLFVVDGASSEENVKVFDRCGNFLFTINDSGLIDPEDVAVNKNGQVIVANGSTGEIFVFDSKGNRLFKFKGSDTSILTVAVSENGHIYITDRAGKVRVFDRCGNFLFAFGAFVSPRLAVNSDGQIVVSEFSKETLTVHDPQGNKLFRLTLGYKPVFVAVNEAGQIIVAAQSEPIPIKVYDRCGNFLTEFGKDEVSTSIVGVAVNADGQIAVSQVTENNGDIVVFE